MFDRDEGIALVKRALAHLESHTTDQAPDTMRASVSEFLDPDVWRDEMETIFKRKPLALALSIDVREGGDYKAMEVLGIPLIVVRGHDGVARAFLNACRHRGAQVCDVGFGNRRRFRCPYHAWVYDDRGALVAILREDTFGDVDKAEYGLRALPVVERAGIIWVVLTPDTPIDLDGWLGSFGPELDSLELGRWYVYRRHEFPGPGWKLTYDGYLEGYHFQTLHKTTFGTNTITNLMVADSFGPHQRVLFGTKSLPKLRDLPEGDWNLGEAAAPIYTVFPNVSIAGTWQDHAMVSQILPGTTPDTCHTVQNILTRHPVTTDAERAAADAYAETMLKGTRDEDYSVAYGAQATLASGANTHLTLGRNEIALQHQHRWIDRMMGRE
jgi:phenylpropionate dioxygenase-like ring-hydroxylating dioxygenase large terminal subunit